MSSTTELKLSTTFTSPSSLAQAATPSSRPTSYTVHEWLAIPAHSLQCLFRESDVKLSELESADGSQIKHKTFTHDFPYLLYMPLFS
jgi:hypothetical protein